MSAATAPDLTKYTDSAVGSFWSNFEIIFFFGFDGTDMGGIVQKEHQSEWLKTTAVLDTSFSPVEEREAQGIV